MLRSDQDSRGAAGCYPCRLRDIVRQDSIAQSELPYLEYVWRPGLDLGPVVLVRVAQDCSVRGHVSHEFKQRKCRYTRAVRALLERGSVGSEVRPGIVGIEVASDLIHGIL